MVEGGFEMNRVAFVLLGAVLLVGAIGPASALAESPVTAAADKDKVQVVNLRAEDIGPATYRATKSFTPDRAPAVVWSGIVATAASAITITGKSPGWYETQNTVDRRSWLGIWVFSLTVTGDYHSTGSTIDKYGSTDYATQCAITWSSNSERSSWAYQDETSGKAKASATFVQAIPTPWGGIQFQQVTESVTARATP
jgi:hypothetical protein